MSARISLDWTRDTIILQPLISPTKGTSRYFPYQSVWPPPTCDQPRKYISHWLYWLFYGLSTLTPTIYMNNGYLWVSAVVLPVGTSPARQTTETAIYSVLLE